MSRSLKMRVRNTHVRKLLRPPEEVGQLIDSLAGPHDGLWPVGSWPAMRLDGPLAVGARGGHGPIRYTVENYERGRSITFRFTAPAGFNGTHGFEVETGAGASVLRHRLEMEASGAALITWPLIYRPLHDALIEDALDRAAETYGEQRRWSSYVRTLRRLLRGKGGRA
jgi:hypothetical protein